MAARRAFKLACVQLAVCADKAVNVSKAVQLVGEAAKAGAQLVVLPECFNSPYGTQYFSRYAECVPGGDTVKALAAAARDNKVYLHGGSIPEQDGERLFNTSTFFSPSGDLLGKYRKMHLFDIDVPGKICFQESETLSPGNSVTVVETEFCKIGLGICYDIRFPELAAIMTQKGCELLLYPGAFNMTTGPAHWELLQRGRALDNQVYVATVSPARDEKASYVAWGHSTVTDPWGRVVATSDHQEGIVFADIDLNNVEEVRSQIPTRNQKRHDIYTLQHSQAADTT